MELSKAQSSRATSHGAFQHEVQKLHERPSIKYFA
jgi:hypothetical protein